MILKETICQDVDERQIILYPPESGNTISFFGAWTIMVNLVLTYDHNYLSGKLGCGIFQSAIIGLVVFSINTISFMVYMRCWRLGKDSSYPGLWKNTIGKSTMWFPRLMIIFGYIYFVVEFYSTMINDVKTISGYYNIKKLSDVAISYSISFLTFLFYGPFPDISFFVKHSIISLISCICIIAMAISLMIHNYQINGFQKNIIWWNNSFYSLEVASIYSIDLFMQPFIHAIFSRLENPSLQRMNKNGIIVQSFVTIWIFIMGTIGYLSFPNNNSSDPIYWKYPTSLRLIASILNFINSFTTNGLIVNLIQREMVDLFLDGTSNKKVAIVPAAVLLIVVGGSLGLWSFNLRHNVKIVGDIINCFLLYILPYIFYFKTKLKMKLREKLVISIFFILGTTLAVFLLYIDYVRIMKNW